MSGELVHQPDPRIDEAKAKIEKLRSELEHILGRRQAVEGLILQFTRRQKRVLGDLVSRLLDLQLERLRRAFKEDPSEENKLALDAVSAMQESFSASQSGDSDDGMEERFELDESESDELKKLFRKALRMCHPDLAPEHLRGKTEAICRVLTQAYKRNDLLVVQDILYQLESEGPGGNKPLELWDRRVDILERRITREKQRVQALEGSEAYQTASRVKDWDEYLENAKAELQKQIEALEA